MLQRDCCNPHIVNIDTKIAEMPLSFYPTACWRVCAPNTLHDVRIAVSGRGLYGANKIEGIVFDEPTALGASLCVCGARYAKPTLDFC